jgi:hypothetical protein
MQLFVCSVYITKTGPSNGIRTLFNIFFNEILVLFYLHLEMNYIFSDNIRILYLSWYVKSPKETVKLSKKSRNKRRSYRF